MDSHHMTPPMTEKDIRFGSDLEEHQNNANTSPVNEKTDAQALRRKLLWKLDTRYFHRAN